MSNKRINLRDSIITSVIPLRNTKRLSNTSPWMCSSSHIYRNKYKSSVSITVIQPELCVQTHNHRPWLCHSHGQRLHGNAIRWGGPDQLMDNNLDKSTISSNHMRTRILSCDSFNNIISLRIKANKWCYQKIYTFLISW